MWPMFTFKTALCWPNTMYVMLRRAKSCVVTVRLRTLSSWLPKHKGFARRYARESCYGFRVTSEVTSSKDPSKMEIQKSPQGAATWVLTFPPIAKVFVYGSIICHTSAKYLTRKTTECLVHSLVSSRLDFANAFLNHLVLLQDSKLLGRIRSQNNDRKITFVNQRPKPEFYFISFSTSWCVKAKQPQVFCSLCTLAGFYVARFSSVLLQIGKSHRAACVRRLFWCCF